MSPVTRDFTARAILVATVVVAGAAFVACRPPGPDDAATDQLAPTEAASVASPVDAEALDAAVDAALADGEPGTALSVWLGPAEGPAWYERDAGVWRPAASAIKTAYLVELFDAHAARLDEPLDDIEPLLAASHPAVTHFDEAQRAEIRGELLGATVREIGHHMIRGTRVSNVVYNAAANVTTAALGGPDELTRAIHARDPDFSGLVVRRYMLAARDVTGDNEATAESLAAVLQRLAARRIRGVESATIDAMLEILALEEQPDAGRHFFKSGSLDSDPLVRIRSGFREGGDGPRVYVVIATRPDPGGLERQEAGRRLQSLAETVADIVTPE